MPLTEPSLLSRGTPIYTTGSVEVNHPPRQNPRGYNQPQRYAFKSYVFRITRFVHAVPVAAFG